MGGTDNNSDTTKVKILDVDILNFGTIKLTELVIPELSVQQVTISDTALSEISSTLSQLSGTLDIKFSLTDDSVSDIADSFKADLSSISGVIDAFPSIIGFTADFIAVGSAFLGAFGGNFVKKINALPIALDEIQNKAKDLNSIISKWGGQLHNAGDGAYYLGKGTKAASENMQKFGVSIGEGLISSLGEMTDIVEAAFKKIGVAISDGIIEGIKSKELMLEHTYYDMANNATYATKSQLKVSSPSKVFMKIGENVSEGLALGIEDGGSEVLDEMNKLTNKLDDGFDDVGKKDFSFGLGGLGVATAALGAIVGFFGNLMESNEEFGAAVDEIWTGITEAFEPVTTAVMGIFDSFSVGTEGLSEDGEAVSGFFTFISEMATGVADMITVAIQWISDFFAEHGETNAFITFPKD